MRLFGWTTGHDRVRELLSPYLDGRVSDRERTAVERHLAACAACRAELDGLRATVMLLRDAPPVPLRRSFTLTPALAEAGPQPAPVRPTLLPTPALTGARWASVAAAMLLVAVVSYDVASTALPSGGARAASEAMPSAAMLQQGPAEKADSARAASPALAPSAFGTPSPEGAGGSTGASPPQATPAAPLSAPGAEDAAASESGQRDFEALRHAPGEAPPVPAEQRSAWAIRWLEALLATVAATAGALWWWGRRPA